MKRRGSYPANREHFARLVPFAQRIIAVCKENGMRPVIYGSFAHFAYTGDKGMNVNDVDIYLDEKDYPKLLRLLKKEKIKAEYNPKWHTLVIKKGDLRVEVDSIDFWYKPLRGKSLPRRFEKVDFYGNLVDMISLTNLERLYSVAYARTDDNKEKIALKMRHLESFLGRKLRR